MKFQCADEIMSRKEVNKSLFYDQGYADADEVKVKKKIRGEVPPDHVPWSNPNGLGAKDKKTRTTKGLVSDDGVGTTHSGTSGGGGRHRVTSARDQDTRPGLKALGKQGYHRPVSIEETGPGAVVVPGMDNEEGYNNSGFTIEEEYDEQAIIPPREEPTLNIIAHVVDTKEEQRILREQYQMHHEQDRMRLERDLAVHDRDQLLRMMSNAVAVKPVVVADMDEESGNGVVAQGAARGMDLPKHDDQNLGTKGRRCFAVGAVLLIVVAIAVAVAVVMLQKSPAPEPATPEPSTSAASARYRVTWAANHSGSCSTLAPKVIMMCAGGSAIELMQEPDQTDCTASASVIVCLGTYSYLPAEFTCTGADLAASARLEGAECTASEEASWARSIQIFLLCSGEPQVVGICDPEESYDVDNICTSGCKTGSCPESTITIPDITSSIVGADCGTLN
jgi:hypothetical protein